MLAILEIRSALFGMKKNFEKFLRKMQENTTILDGKNAVF